MNGSSGREPSYYGCAMCRGWGRELMIQRYCDACRELRASRPAVVVLCGSSRFIDQMAILGWELEKNEGVIVLGLHLLPQWYISVLDDMGRQITCQDHHQAEAEEVAGHMDELHLRKIDMADRVLVVNVDGYIGDSTRAEIEYATEAGKPISYLEATDGI